MFFDALTTASGSLASFSLGAFNSAEAGLSGVIGVSVPAAALGYEGAREFLPYRSMERLAKSILELDGQTTTGRWMDALEHCPSDIFRGHHRAYHGHHFITDGIKVLQHPELSFADFVAHLGTDVVTKAGLPVLPASSIKWIADTFGVPMQQVVPWVSFNIADIGMSAIAIYDTTQNIASILNGSSTWSIQYGLETLGFGLSKVYHGFNTANPVLVVAGGADVICGVKTAVDYYSQPFFLGAPMGDILRGAGFGALLGSVCGVIEVLAQGRDAPIAERMKLIAGRAGESAFISALQVVSVTASASVSCGLVGVRLGRMLAEDTNRYIELMPIEGRVASILDRAIIKAADQEAVLENMLRRLR